MQFNTYLLFFSLKKTSELNRCAFFVEKCRTLHKHITIASVALRRNTNGNGHVLYCKFACLWTAASQTQHPTHPFESQEKIQTHHNINLACPTEEKKFSDVVCNILYPLLLCWV